MLSEIYEFLTSNWLLNTNFFNAATTLVVGFTAYFIYKKQKRDEKKDAATILLAEIKSATAILPGLVARFDDRRTIESGLILLPSESWSKYKYLFVNDLKAEEWQAVDKFYKNCLDYDKALAEQQSYFAQNTGQVWVSIHKNYHDMLQKYFDDNPDIDITAEPRGDIVEINPDVAQRISAFTDTYIANTSRLASYDPLKPINDAERALKNINQNLLLSSVGSSLERLANPRIIFKNQKPN